MKRYTLETSGNGLTDITEEIKDAVAASGVTAGLVTVMVPHTTAAVTVYSFPDPLGLDDMNQEIGRLIPTRVDFLHQHDTPQDAAGHIKSALIGINATFIIDNRELVLGHSQKIYFFEFDGPRSRQFYVQVAGSA
ncbi:MAG: YjbQ family protein [Caldilineaceae bacterium]|nr:secondary thiamine-phosphate synthase enzyme YjbQ [Caldilineaceae bacterium]MCB9137952.1 YjbQ family protein [Caldilineaceae bacterium]